jgi:protein TonB
VEQGKSASLALLRDDLINVTPASAPVFGVPTGDPSQGIMADVGLVKGEAIKRVQPKPPAIRVPGAVVVEITVDEQGDVISARAASGHPLLVPPALNAAREWKFAPTTAAGIP